MVVKIVPPSNQMQLELEGDKGYMLMQEAHQWIKDNPDAWERYIDKAHELNARGRVASNYLKEYIRNELRVRIKTDLAPYLARIAKEKYPYLNLILRRSKADGYTKAVL